jgi:hypothetical protein
VAQRFQHRCRCHLQRCVAGGEAVSPHLARPGDVPAETWLVPAPTHDPVRTRSSVGRFEAVADRGRR